MLRPCLFLAVALLLTAAVGCGGTNPGDGQRLVRGNVEAPATLDPALAGDVHSFNILFDLYEGLIAEDAGGRLIPGVAESWSIDDSGRVYTFRLRPDAKWSNGDPVVAGDFVRSFRRVAGPDSQAPYSFLLAPIEHFAEVADGKLPDDALGVVALDDLTLQLRLTAPVPYFPGVLAMPVAFPVHGDGVETDRVISNGAYALAERRIDGPVLLRRNDHLHSRDNVSIAEVEYLPIIDENAEMNMFRSGDLHITAVIPSAQLHAMQQTRPDDVRIAPMLALYYLAFDLTEPLLQNRELRQALSMAIDRDQLVEIIGRGEIAAFGIVPPGVSDYPASRYSWQSLDAEERRKQAASLLETAAQQGTKLTSIKLTYDAGGIHERIALAVADMWHRTLGLDVTHEKKEWQYFLADRDNRDSWQVMRFAWFGDYNDASTFTDVFRSSSDQNLPRYRSEPYDSLLRQADAETNPVRRQQLLSDAEESLLEDYPIAPLYFFVSKHLVSDQVRGWEDNVMDRHPTRFLSLIDE